MGELPIVFPKSWRFSDDDVMRIGAEYGGRPHYVRSWFGINANEYMHLFFPNNQKARLYGGRELGRGARKESVAKNIRAFIAKKREKK